MAFLYEKERLILVSALIISPKKELLLLHKIKHAQWEPPGGKVEESDCIDPKNPTLEDFGRAVKREVFEEIGDQITLDPLKYFGSAEGKTPSGRPALFHKFVSSITSGRPFIAEPHAFDALTYIPIKELEKHHLSPDLPLFLKQLREHVKKM